MQAARKLEYQSIEPSRNYPRPTKRIRRVRRRRRRLPDTLVVSLAVILVVVAAMAFLGQHVYTMHTNIQAQRLGSDLQFAAQKHEQLLVQLQAAQSLRNVENLARNDLGMVNAPTQEVLVVTIPNVMLSHESETIDQRPRTTLADLGSAMQKWLSLGGVRAGWSGQ